MIIILFPHPPDPIVVSTMVVNSNQILVSWTTPQLVTDQGVSQYQIVVTRVCSTGVATTRQFTATPSDPSSVTISSLGKPHKYISINRSM